MRIFYTPEHENHQPPAEIFNGHRMPHQEKPVRIKRILAALEETEHQISELSLAVGSEDEAALLAIIKATHDDGYLTFLQNSSSLDEGYHYPSIFPFRSESSPPENFLAKNGYYCFDLYTPISNQTYSAAVNSAYLAWKSAQRALQTGETHFALCRPPGHHAESGKMGGYCYLNNGAIAANTMKEEGVTKAAILDLDIHHGNGAEQIFSQDSKVLTISIHATPAEHFPYFSGYDHQLYQVNKNYPLPLGTNNDQYQQTLKQALEVISDFGPDGLVVSYGADTHQDDPIGGFNLITNYYAQVGAQIASLSLPTVILQEGGYDTAYLGQNVASFLSGF